jgi:DNA-directed RNA polymerase specialized sigma24 family protein
MTTIEIKLGGDELSPAEVAQAIRALSDAEKTALIKIAMHYARKTQYGYEDLIQESFLRVLDGRRPWPRRVGVVSFLAGVARSIAWDWKYEPIDRAAAERDPAMDERNAIAQMDAAKIIAIFDDDPAARTIVQGMLEGARGEELRAFSGLNETDYESKRKKIRRRIEKRFSIVWKA